LRKPESGAKLGMENRVLCRYLMSDTLEGHKTPREADIWRMLYELRGNPWSV